MNQPKRVLQVVTIMNQGGAETMVMNHYRVVDHTKVQFDFLVCREDRGFYDDEVERLGGRIFRSVPIRPWQYGKFWNWLDQFFKEHASEFTAVHSHIQENSGFVFKYAQKYGIKTCIAHSHIALKGIDCKIPFRKFAHVFQLKYATCNLSCGEDAGHYLYGNRPFELFNNAIDTHRFRYNEDVRHHLRAELGIENRFVLGSVARITWQKNHTFMLDVMSALTKLCPEICLILVGKGEKEPEIRQKIVTLGLERHVLLLGNRSDVPDLLQAFDIFFMPSLFEGLPVSVIEAQAAGLKCVLSDTIDVTTDVTGNVTFVSLKDSLDVWCDRILSLRGLPRVDTIDYIKNAGYDVHANVSRLMELYGIEDACDAGTRDSHLPLVTVGLPVWNGAQWVKEAIMSVLNQSFPEFELIISDDGSTDETLEIVRGINDERIRIIEGKENRGIAYRLNEQVRLAKGRYFARMDADDLMFPTRLEKQLTVFKAHPKIDVLGSSIVVMDDNRKIIGFRSSLGSEEELGVASYPLHPTVMVRTKWLRMHPYNTAYSGWEDYELWLRTRRYSTFMSINEPLLFYRDSIRMDVRKFVHRRIVGCRVLWNEWMLFDSFLVAARALGANILSILSAPFCRLLNLDKWRSNKRNRPLNETQKKRFEVLLNQIID